MSNEENTEETELVVDISALSWVNMLLASIWPKANAALISYVHEELTPRLQQALPAPFRGVHFSRFTLGLGVPELGPVEVMRRSERHVQIELDMRYSSNVDILLQTGAGGISFGIRKLFFAGRLCLALRPLLDKTPVVGGVQLFFANQPRVELKFAGLANDVARFPGLTEKVQQQVGLLFQNMVLPNFMSFQTTRDEQIVDLTYACSQQALGVLRVRVLRARNLAGAKWQMGLVESFTSDPYCVLRLGASTFKTSTVRGTTTPSWPVSEPSAYFIVYHHEQELEIDLFNEDQGILRRTPVKFLGRMPASSVRTLLHRAEPTVDGGMVQRQRRAVLDTSEVQRSLLHVNDPVNVGIPSELDLALEWLDSVPSRHSDMAQPPLASLDANGPPVGLLLVELYTGTGFPEESIVNMKKGLRWQCRLNQELQGPVCSKKGTCVSEALERHQQELESLQLDDVLLPIIDRLYERDVAVKEIASIVDVEEEVVSKYLDNKKTLMRQAEERRQKVTEANLEVKWHETLTLLVRRPEGSFLIVELLDGSDNVVGQLDTIPLRLFADDVGIPRTSLKLGSQPSTVENRAGKLSSLLFPTCSQPLLAKKCQFHAVKMEISLQFQHLVSACAPRTLGALAASSEDSDAASRRSRSKTRTTYAARATPRRPSCGSNGRSLDFVPTVAALPMSATPPRPMSATPPRAFRAPRSSALDFEAMGGDSPPWASPHTLAVPPPPVAGEESEMWQEAAMEAAQNRRYTQAQLAAYVPSGSPDRNECGS